MDWPPKKKSKYTNTKVEYNGIKFDSLKEMRRFKQLMILGNAGVITDLVLQPRFLLQDKFNYRGKSHRKIEYIADFQYMQDGKTITEDVKASENYTTDVYKIKKKMLLFRYPEINFVEVFKV